MAEGVMKLGTACLWWWLPNWKRRHPVLLKSWMLVFVESAVVFSTCKIFRIACLGLQALWDSHLHCFFLFWVFITLFLISTIYSFSWGGGWGGSEGGRGLLFVCLSMLLLFCVGLYFVVLTFILFAFRQGMAMAASQDPAPGKNEAEAGWTVVNSVAAASLPSVTAGESLICSCSKSERIAVEPLSRWTASWLNFALMGTRLKKQPYWSWALLIFINGVKI